jgi:hypothetical protein
LEKAETLNNPIDFAMGYWFKAQTQLCRGLIVEADATFAKAQTYANEIAVYKGGWAFLGLGRVHFSQSYAHEITGKYRSALEDDPQLVYRNPYQAVNEIIKLERSFDALDDFHAFADRFRQEHPELQHAQFQQWYLVPGEITQHPSDPILLDFNHDPIPDDWIWVDPLGDCSFHLDRGLTIHAANEHNLFHINSSAPRIIRKESIKGDFIIQVVCMAAAEDKPAIGGLLFWQDEKNWLCLELGARGQDEIIFRGFKDNQDMVFGRGRLNAVSTFLRLEKRGYQVKAYCGSDGENWFYLGSTTMPTSESVSPGLHANGHINRLIYPGAFVDGTAITFKELRLWVVT